MPENFTNKELMESMPDLRTPFDELAESEELQDLRESACDGAVYAVSALLDWLFWEGPAPDKVAKRAYVLAQALRPEVLPKATCDGVAKVFGETRAATSARVKRVYQEFISSYGFRVKAPFQRSRAARENLSRALRGNVCKKKSRKNQNG